MTELKPCPFCGGKGKFTELYKNIFVVSCPNCGVGTAIFSHPEKAIEAWDRRAEAEVVKCWECEYYYFLAATKKQAGRCKKFGTDGSGPDLSLYDFCSFGKPLPDRRRGENNGEHTGTMA